MLRARLSIKSDLVLALAVNILTIIPGSMVLEIDQERRLIYVHVHRCRQRQGRRTLPPAGRYRLERLLVAAFERDADWQPTSAKEDA